MIRSFRTAIGTLGSGSILIAAAALSRDQLPRCQVPPDRGLGAVHRAWDEPAEVAGVHLIHEAGPSGLSIVQTLPPAAGEASSGGPIRAAVPDRTPEKRSAVFQNASIRFAPQQCGPSIQIGPLMPAEKAGLPRQNTGEDAVSSTARPVVVLKPEERPIADREKFTAATSDTRRAALVTRLYHPSAMSVSDLERLIRPLLTPGMGTATAYTTAATDDGPADGSVGGTGVPRPDVLLVHDRPEVMRQIDAIYSDLEATPKRVVIDALIADVTLPDSVPPGWELRQSQFGMIEAKPRTVLDSLRVLGRVRVIATNQLQVIDGQWAQLEWTQRACQLPAGREPVAAGWDASLRLATKFRIRPSVLSSGRIRLEVHPTSSRLKEGSSVRPEIATVAFTTDIVLHAGATAVIAGSVDEHPQTSNRFPPPRRAISQPGDAPNIHPQPSVRHETVLLLMPRIFHEN